MKIKKKSVWTARSGNGKIRVSRLRKDEIFFYAAEGGGAEQKLRRTAFLAQYEPA